MSEPRSDSSTHLVVAAEVRAHLARKRISGRQAAFALGWKQPYISRRLSGDIPFDVNDLAALAELLEVPVTAFFEVPYAADRTAARGSMISVSCTRRIRLGLVA